MNEEGVSNNKIDSWLSWFCSRKSAPIIDQTKKALLFQTFKASLSDDECRNQLEKQEEITFLCVTSFGKGRVTIIHHIKQIRGSLGAEEEYIGAIQGLRKNSTCIITPDMDRLISIAAKDEFIPTTYSTLEVTSIRDIEELKMTNVGTISARSIIPIPPFLLEIIKSTIRALRGDSRAVLLETVKEIERFNNELNTRTLPAVEKARDSCIDLFLWLYLSVNHKIKPTPILGCCKETVKNYYERLEKMLFDYNPATENVNQESQAS